MEDIRYRQGIEDGELLAGAMAELGYRLSARQSEQFMAYRRMLLEWNTRMNLTAITDPREVLLKHFVDSAAAARLVSGSVLDVGTGAGFPGVPIKILRPQARLTLMDSLGKRLRFLKALGDELGLEICCVHARAEDAARTSLRESFDVVVSRAVAAMPVLAEYCLPFAAPGGIVIALKGPAAAEEVESAAPAIDALGARVIELRRITIPYTDIERSLVIIGKIRQTPDKYPRSSKKIANAPIS